MGVRIGAGSRSIAMVRQGAGAVLVGLSLTALPACEILGESSYATIEVTNNCGKPVDLWMSERGDPREEVLEYPEADLTVGPGGVLKYGSQERRGDFQLAVFDASGGAATPAWLWPVVG